MAKGQKPKKGNTGGAARGKECPPEFEIIFIEIGRIECESRFKVARTTVNRWLEECGKERLLTARRAFVKAKHAKTKNRKSKPKKLVDAPIGDRTPVDPRLLEFAIHFLQSSANGGWAIVSCESGDFIVGTIRRSPAELLALAERKGFNRARAEQQLRAFAEPI